jgi:hypothetical protein
MGNVTEFMAEPLTKSDGAAYGIKGSIDRLHRLAVRIRRSSKDGLPERVRAFAKKLPSDDSENIISRILQFKYPNMKTELVNHLTKTIIYRHHRLMYIRRHQGKLAHERDQETQSHSEAPECDLSHNTSQPKSDMTGLQSDISKPSLGDGYSETAPSIMNTEVYNQQDNVKQAKPSTVAGSVSSSWVGKITYPAPPANAENSSHVVCQFCFEEFPAAEFEQSQSWRYGNTMPNT